MSKQQGSSPPPVRATVKKVVARRPIEESYVVAYPIEDHGELKKEHSVTFSLSKWRGKGRGLYHGQVVELHDVVLFEHGWRAALARPVVPQQQADSRSAQ